MGKYFVISQDGVSHIFDGLLEAWTRAIMIESTYLYCKDSNTWGVSYSSKATEEIDIQILLTDDAIPPEIKTKVLLLI